MNTLIPSKKSESELIVTAARTDIDVLAVDDVDEGDRSHGRLVLLLKEGPSPLRAYALMFALNRLSFREAQPQNGSVLEYLASDDWTVKEMRLWLERTTGTLAVSTDYVRGRMMKTNMTTDDERTIVVTTRKRPGLVSRMATIIQSNSLTTLDPDLALLDEKTLRFLAVVAHLSQFAIAERMGCTYSAVERAYRVYRIRRRQALHPTASNREVYLAVLRWLGTHSSIPDMLEAKATDAELRLYLRRAIKWLPLSALREMPEITDLVPVSRTA